MEKLILQEIWSDFQVRKIKKPYNQIISIVLVLIGIVPLSLVSTESLVIIFIIFSNSMLESKISDCIYIIPVNVREYIKAKYRITILIELFIYTVIEVIRYIICITSDEKLSYAFVLEQLFVSIALIIYVLIKNTWLLYVNFGLKEMQTYKAVQGLSLVWIFCITIIADIAEIMNTMPLVLELFAVGGFIAYGIYICTYVKKNLIIKTFR